MKIGVIGCGSIGLRHISNLIDLGQDVIASDPNPNQTKKVVNKYKIKTYLEVDELLKEKPDAVFICTPNHLHVKIAKRCLNRGINCFIEKPVSDNIDDLDSIKKYNQRIFVACNIRFHPAIQKIKELLKKIGKIYSVKAEYGHYLPYWRPAQDYRETYSAKKIQGGGIILDSIHEIDYVSWLFGKPTKIFCFADKLSNLEIDVEDNAEITLITENNVYVYIHLDYLQKIKRRSCQIVGSEGTILWESIGKKPERAVVRYYNGKEEKWFDYEIEVEPNEQYVLETKHFLKVLEGKEKPISNLESGEIALKTVLLAKKSAETKKMFDL